MKIAIASNDEISVANHFGRALGFAIYQVENGIDLLVKYPDNTLYDNPQKSCIH